MAKGGSEPEGPDTGKIEKGFQWSNKFAKKRAQNHFRWAKKQARKNWNVTKPVVANLKEMMADQMANSQEDRDRYEQFFVPREAEYAERIEGIQGEADQFAASVAKLKQDALDYGSEANKAFRVGQAQAGVTSAFEEAKRNSERTLSAAGVNPAATRFASLTYGLDAARAAEQARAGTEMGMTVDETARAMFDEALTREAQALGIDMDINKAREGFVNLGRGLAGQAQVGAELGGRLGTSAADTRLKVSDINNRMRVDTNEFLRTLNSGLSEWGNMLNSSYNAATQRQTAEAQQSSGIGGVLGAVLPFAKNLPIFAQEGGEIPVEASASAGAIDDDVPTMLTAGEYVLPREAVEVLGTRYLDKLRAKAMGEYDQNMAADEAIPETVF